MPGTDWSPGFGHPSASTPRPGTFKPEGQWAPLRWATAPVPEAGVPRVREPTAPPATERQPAWQGRIRRGSRCGLPPEGGFWPLPSSLLHILSGAGWAPGCPARTAGPRTASRGPPHYGGGPARCNFPYPVGHPHHPPSGAPGGLAKGPA